MTASNSRTSPARVRASRVPAGLKTAAVGSGTGRRWTSRARNVSYSRRWAAAPARTIARRTPPSADRATATGTSPGPSGRWARGRPAVRSQTRSQRSPTAPVARNRPSVEKAIRSGLPACRSHESPTRAMASGGSGKFCRFRRNCSASGICRSGVGSWRAAGVVGAGGAGPPVRAQTSPPTPTSRTPPASPTPVTVVVPASHPRAARSARAARASETGAAPVPRATAADRAAAGAASAASPSPTRAPAVTPRRASRARSRSRARVSRDSTVPTGQPRARAASAVERSSTSHRTNVSRNGSGRASISASITRSRSRLSAAAAGPGARVGTSGGRADMGSRGVRTAAVQRTATRCNQAPTASGRRTAAACRARARKVVWNASSAEWGSRPAPAGAPDQSAVPVDQGGEGVRVADGHEPGQQLGVWPVVRSRPRQPAQGLDQRRRLGHVGLHHVANTLIVGTRPKTLPDFWPPARIPPIRHPTCWKASPSTACSIVSGRRPRNPLCRRPLSPPGPPFAPPCPSPTSNCSTPPGPPSACPRTPRTGPPSSSSCRPTVRSPTCTPPGSPTSPAGLSRPASASWPSTPSRRTARRPSPGSPATTGCRSRSSATRTPESPSGAGPPGRPRSSSWTPAAGSAIAAGWMTSMSPAVRTAASRPGTTWPRPSVSCSPGHP